MDEHESKIQVPYMTIYRAEEYVLRFQFYLFR